MEIIPASARNVVVPVSSHYTAGVGEAFLHCVDKDSIRVEMDIRLPPRKEKKKKKTIAEERGTTVGSYLSTLFNEQKFPEPVYFQNVDCVGLPNFLTPQECGQIRTFAEAQGFSQRNREGVLNIQWTDIVDPFFAESLWQVCGLGWFFRTITIDGMVPCGLNDVVRIHKFVQGSHFSRHTDQHITRVDGRVSKYTLRVFLNGVDQEPSFQGGFSVFHVPFREEPVTFEPECGLGLLYPQGELCAVQEETEVLAGCKYVLRADVLFCRPCDLEAFGGKFGGTVR